MAASGFAASLNSRETRPRKRWTAAACGGVGSHFGTFEQKKQQFTAACAMVLCFFIGMCLCKHGPGGGELSGQSSARSDLALLEGPHWLNDQVIGFAFEYFSSERFTDLKESIAFISPEMS
ncbi:hypothetical protein WMY93_012576 [Mugilogobius chulae]|uniref:Uncharacterized protein n=1 Tax=Mugilogobius chulae TaxID=88201 RepID=A0AAW0NWZ4_9GOBI